MNLYVRVVLIAVLIMSVSCTPEPGLPESSAGESATEKTQSSFELTELLGLWRIEISLQGQKLPFFLEFSTRDSQLSAVAINGQERVNAADVSIVDGQIVIDYPAFNTKITARLKNSVLHGELVLIKAFGEEQHMPVSGSRNYQARFVQKNSQSPFQFSGKWAVEFVDDDGEKTPAIGEFHQQKNQINGTFLTATGDYRFLSGNVDGKRMFLSTFDGGHAFLFSATVNDQGQLDGHFWSGTAWHERWTARRDETASLADASKLTYLKPGYQGIEFGLPDTNGKIVSLDDEKYQGKVVVISLSGSWCPNCHDKAAFLSPLYKQRQSQGLEVISLMFEHFEDFARASHQVNQFRDKFDIDYQLLIAGISDKTEAGKVLPMLNHILAFPTTIFIDRKGQIRKIHTGFSGPGTGDHYIKLTREFTALIDELLAE